MLKLIENGNLLINFVTFHCYSFSLYKVSYFADVDINGYEVQGINY